MAAKEEVELATPREEPRRACFARAALTRRAHERRRRDPRHRALPRLLTAHGQRHRRLSSSSSTPAATDLLHRASPGCRARTLWDLRDPQGVHVIRELIARVPTRRRLRAYLWEKPSARTLKPKLAYAISRCRAGT